MCLWHLPRLEITWIVCLFLLKIRPLNTQILLAGVRHVSIMPVYWLIFIEKKPKPRRVKSLAYLRSPVSQGQKAGFEICQQILLASGYSGHFLIPSVPGKVVQSAEG